VFELKPSSPRLRAQKQQHAATAELNKQLAQQIPALADWQQLQAFLQQHGSVLNFLAVTAVASQAAVLHKVGCYAAVQMRA
jgi:alkylhydroperoxidase family enzyme